jgi:hypothetical protein
LFVIFSSEKVVKTKNSKKMADCFRPCFQIRLPPLSVSGGRSASAHTLDQTTIRRPNKNSVDRTIDESDRTSKVEDNFSQASKKKHFVKMLLLF